MCAASSRFCNNTLHTSCVGQTILCRSPVIVTMPTARLLLMYLTYIVSCRRTYYTSQTLTRPVVIVVYCLASIWLLANLGPLQRMLPERGAGLGLGSNYGLRCPLARAGDP